MVSVPTFGGRTVEATWVHVWPLSTVTNRPPIAEPATAVDGVDGSTASDSGVEVSPLSA